jgi:hypothetical protein
MAPKLRWGEALAGLGSALLLVSLFLPWFGSPNVTAWEAFAVVDLLLLGAAALGLFMAFAAATYAKPDLPISTQALSVPAGLIATLLVIFRLLDPAGGGDREVGLYLGLAAAVALLLGAWGAVRSER